MLLTCLNVLSESRTEKDTSYIFDPLGWLPKLSVDDRTARGGDSTKKCLDRRDFCTMVISYSHTA